MQYGRMRHSRRFNQLPREVQDRYIDRDIQIAADLRKIRHEAARDRWIERNRYRFAAEADPERAARAAFYRERAARKAA